MPASSTRLARFSLTLFAAALCTAAVSCSALSQPAPGKAFFSIDPGEPTPVAPSPAVAPAVAATTTASPPASSPADSALQVRRLRIASPYDGQEFVYRTSSNEYRTDYYNGFIAAPDQLLTAALTAWLSRARVGRFASVVDAASDIPARYVLEGNVTSLYGDYADKAAPKAVITIKIFLFDDGDANARVIFQKEYSAAAPIELGSAPSLVKGWSQAFRQVLEQITADLNQRFPAGT